MPAKITVYKIGNADRHLVFSFFAKPPEGSLRGSTPFYDDSLLSRHEMWRRSIYPTSDI